MQFATASRSRPKDLQTLARRPGAANRPIRLVTRPTPSSTKTAAPAATPNIEQPNIPQTNVLGDAVGAAIITLAFLALAIFG